jgi:hypothetical protein
MTGQDLEACKAKVREAAGPVLTRILPPEFRAKARAEGPSGNRALLENRSSQFPGPFSGSFSLSRVRISAARLQRF